MPRRWFLITCCVSVWLQSASALSEITFLGPTPYLSVADSPFDMSGLGTDFFFYDMEDGTFNPYGTSPVSGTVFGPGPQSDSVDADDGVVDGFGNGGHHVVAPGLLIHPTGIPIIVNSFRLEFGYNFTRRPKTFGFVWTDGFPNSEFIFRGVAGDLQDFDVVYHGLGDDNFTGETEEDRFIGVISTSGIVWIEMIQIYRSSTVLKRFEFDHVQYGYQLPEPGGGTAMFILGISFVSCRVHVGRRR